jgi:hypothetical protein
MAHFPHTNSHEPGSPTDPHWEELLACVSDQLDHIRSASLQRKGEPHSRSLADPPGKALTQAYLSVNERRAIGTAKRPVFYAEVPPPPKNWRTNWLLKSLLAQWGDPDWHKRTSGYNQQLRLENAWLLARVELLIIADVHHLVLPNGKVLATELDVLLDLSTNRVKIPMVLVGEPTRMQQLLWADDRFGLRFPRILFLDEMRLPHMPNS